MKIKRLCIDRQQSENSLAVAHDGQWIVLKRLLCLYPEDKSDQCVRLSQTADDLIGFLQSLPETGDKLRLLLASADLGACRQTKEMQEIIPFRPLSHRGFSLFESHAFGGPKSFKHVKHMWSGPYSYEKPFKKMHPHLHHKKTFSDNPLYYKGNPLTFVGSNETVVFPEYATLLDYELELGAIITKDVFNATEEEGLEAIGALCVFNNFCARNVLLKEMSIPGFGPSKARDFGSSISNIVVTADEILPYLNILKARVFINGKITARGKLSDFHHSLGSMVAYASRGERVYAGEFMGTGTIPNCCGAENGQMLKQGDLVRLEIDRIGEVANPIYKASM